jgi:hypothetical protein
LSLRTATEAAMKAGAKATEPVKAAKPVKATEPVMEPAE